MGPIQSTPGGKLTTLDPRKIGLAPETKNFEQISLSFYRSYIARI